MQNRTLPFSSKKQCVIAIAALLFPRPSCASGARPGSAVLPHQIRHEQDREVVHDVFGRVDDCSETVEGLPAHPLRFEVDVTNAPDGIDLAPGLPRPTDGSVARTLTL